MPKHNFRQVRRLSSDKIIKIVSRTLEYINTPISLGIYLRIKNNLPIDADVNPSNYLDPHTYQKDSQALALISKNPHYSCGIDTAQAALDVFLACEDKNRATNQFFIESYSKPRIGFEWQCLYTARQFVYEILKCIPVLRPDFGPGSSISLKGEHTNLISKLQTTPEVTPHAHDVVLRLILDTMPQYAISSGIVTRTRTSVFLSKRHLPLVNSNVFSSVPKNWKTDRPICIEPLGNMLAQKAVGGAIRHRLKYWGLDLNQISADDIHGQLAKLGSLDDSISTIDLASASDTVSYQLVKFLLPAEWFDLLSSLRCRKTTLPDKTVITNEKFSSMGNGYTFELETLIFYALALAVRKLRGARCDRVSVFGDDIIVSRSIALPLCRLLDFCGFSLNTEKTFITGPFKESCGKDYFSGILVRPIYVKEAIEDRKPIESLFYMANRIYETAYRSFADHCFDPSFRPLWINILQRIPTNLRFVGPESLGDTCLRVDGDVGIRRFLIRKEKKIQIPTDPHHLLAVALAGIKSTGCGYRGAPYRLNSRKWY